ncbi:hypothetical protein LX64_03182 [Chitinophaga skermanii]|uniref:Uncharacterized protein n=1 Tax=Chitinophaga skermanii TaxID=331697 RepID=A0A327QKT7_9BACT|nr:hypothetical protein [Chitinophaga skermanii]RAJ04302.1 hypothetical protein LX64_03182 [Chitinophaga skermanii]
MYAFAVFLPYMITGFCLAMLGYYVITKVYPQKLSTQFIATANVLTSILICLHVAFYGCELLLPYFSGAVMVFEYIRLAPILSSILIMLIAAIFPLFKSLRRKWSTSFYMVGALLYAQYRAAIIGWLLVTFNRDYLPSSWTTANPIEKEILWIGCGTGAFVAIVLLLTEWKKKKKK